MLAAVGVSIVVFACLVVAAFDASSATGIAQCNYTSMHTVKCSIAWHLCWTHRTITTIVTTATAIAIVIM
eukprot:7926462-Alexandrium_andersonii.AAC.1